jgi:hypothetical protein
MLKTSIIAGFLFEFEQITIIIDSTGVVTSGKETVS